jgi:hypothetical protein
VQRIKDFPLEKHNFYMFSSLDNRPCILVTCESINSKEIYTIIYNNKDIDFPYKIGTCIPKCKSIFKEVIKVLSIERIKI